MKKSSVLIFIGFIASFCFSYGQHRIKNPVDLNGYNAIPKETVYIHHNDSFLLAGEYLYYKLYCLNAENNRPSDVSKMAYVELVGKDKQLIFKHKIKLRSGLGQGDFFIPTTIPSGNYKLIGYTQWMRNTGQEHFFISDIAIVNPYRELQTPIQSKLGEQPPPETTNGHLTDSTIPQRSSGLFTIDIAKKKYGKRRPVFLKIKNLHGIKGHGSYSISVRKKEDNQFAPPQTANDFSYKLSKTNMVANPIRINDSIYLPELRGELISGKILSRTDNTPIANERISVSIPSNNPISKIANTNDDGVFFFSLNKPHRSSDATLQLLGDNKEQKRIVLLTSKPLNYDSFNFEEFNISNTMNNLILEQSIYNQIENAYFEKKTDSIVTIQSNISVYEDLPETYLLDDYTRFPSIKETIVEIIENVWLKKVKGEYIFQIREHNPLMNESHDLPLVMVDGILIEHLNDLLNYKAKEIKKISVSRYRHYIGSQLFYGIISFETKANDFAQKMNKDNIYNAKISSPLPLKNYYFQKYTEESSKHAKRLPDYRSQLLWEPNLKLNDQESHLVFYTSDNTGHFEISLEGYTQTGEPVSISEIIQVE